MIWIAFVRISYSGYERLMTQALCCSDSISLCLVVLICDTCPVRVLQNIMGDGTSFRASLRLGLYVNIRHYSPL
jgi:hypothetical protein